MKETIIYFATKQNIYGVRKFGFWSVEAAKRWTDKQGWKGRGKVEHWAYEPGDDTAKKVAVYQY